ncbi:MAG: hypothetical protein ACYC2H_00170 [Thermoplasmatota archaeon]
MATPFEDEVLEFRKPSPRAVQLAEAMASLDPFSAKGLAVFDLAYGARAPKRTMYELAIVHADEGLRSERAWRFVYPWGRLEPPRLPEAWSKLPVVVYEGSEEDLLERLLESFAGRIPVSYNAGSDVAALRHMWNRCNLPVAWPAWLPCYDPMRYEILNGPPPRTLPSVHARIHPALSITKSALSDALMALDVARHQVRGDFGRLQRYAHVQGQLHKPQPTRSKFGHLVKELNGELHLMFGKHPGPLRLAPNSYVNYLLRSDLDVTTKQRIAQSRGLWQ